MDINKIKELVMLGESTTIEFKTSTSELSKACQTVCAFLNTKGGIVLIGVKNNGQIIGQHVTDNTKLEIARELKKIEPPVHNQITINYLPFDQDKHIIVLEVMMLGGHAPYTYDGRSYVRIESSTGLMSQHLYEQLLVQRGQLNYSWDIQPAGNEYTVDSLDHEAIRRTIKDGVDKHRIGIEVLNYDIDHILRNLELVKNDKLTNAAVVLYAKKVQLDYSQCMIRLARFRGTDKLGNFVDNQRVYGNAFRIISAALEFAQRHLPIASFFESGKMQRIDQPAVPQLALREALINAISHRDYSNRSASISLAIYDDRLELWNNGVLPPQLDIEALRKRHESYPRNKMIATIFYEQGWVEGWGTGTTRMISYCQQNGTPEPEFSEYSGGFAVTFRFKEAMGSPAIHHASHDKLTARQEKIIAILSTGYKMSVKDIAILLEEAAPAARTLRNDLAQLRKLGLIELEGSAKTAKWFLVKK